MKRITIKQKGSTAAATPPDASTSQVLMATRGTWDSAAVRWSDFSAAPPPDGFTLIEMQRLRDKHKTGTPNLIRAMEVKKLIRQGLTCTRIVQTLRGKYGERSIKSDHAALSPTGRG